MKFSYTYRDSNNERHDGFIVASSKDDVFKKLRAEGIKPFWVAPAPGLANRILGFGKRGLAIAVLCLLVGVLLPFAIHKPEPMVVGSDMTRRQLIGDAFVIEKGIRNGWSDVFVSEGDRFLAGFAIPGAPVAVRSTSPAEIEKVLGIEVPLEAGDSIEARQIKQIVSGMKAELREFLRRGGSVVRYGQKLVERQESEAGYYNRVKRELETAKRDGMDKDELEELWERRNEELRKMGIGLVPMPD